MKRTYIVPALIILVFLLSILLRVWGLGFDLPYIYSADEPVVIKVSQQIFRTGDLNPHFFDYPSLHFYINALSYVPYYLLGKLIGMFHTRADMLPLVSLTMGVTLASMPSVVLLGRIITVCFGIGAVALIYLSGRQIAHSTAVGALAAFMLATSPTNVLSSRVIKPDTLVVFFALASLLASVLIVQQGKTWQYVLAGLCVGLTASSKYNGGLVVLSLVAAHFLRCGKEGFRQPKLYLALLLCAVGFLATTPFALLDPAGLMHGLSSVSLHYSSGHEGMEGNTLQWYLDYAWSTGGGLYLLAVLGIVYGAFVRLKETALVSIFPIAYFALISRIVVRNEQTFLPVTPFLFILAAWFLVTLFDKYGARQRLATAVALSLAIAALVLPLTDTISEIRALTSVNSRETARIWIDDNLPSGAKVAIESYSPFIDPSRFAVQGFGRMIDNDPAWYIAQGFDYLVFSQGMYARFYADPQRYPSQTALYDRLFGSFSLIKIFNDGGYEVRVYRVK